jgi:hypothetical protein
MKWLFNLLYNSLLFLIFSMIASRASTQEFISLQASGGGGSLGEIRASLRGKEALFQQIAGLSSMESSLVGINAKNHYFLQELIQGSMALALKTNPNLWIYSRIDFLKHYEWLQQQFSLGLGKRLGETLTLGLSLNYQMVSMPIYGRLVSLNADLSLQYDFNPTLSLGFLFQNFLPVNRGNEPKVAPYSEVGMRYVLSDKIELHTSFSSELDYKFSLHAGIHYLAFKELTFKTGFFSEPGGFTLGIQYSSNNNFTIEMQSVYHLVLGNSPSALLIYHW